MSTGSSGSGNAYSLKCLEEDRLLKNSLDGRFHPKSDTNRHQTRCFWGYWSPICGRYQFNADFFNRLRISRNYAAAVGTFTWSWVPVLPFAGRIRARGGAGPQARVR
jgi:hypothetical protein